MGISIELIHLTFGRCFQEDTWVDIIPRVDGKESIMRILDDETAILDKASIVPALLLVTSTQRYWPNNVP